MSLSRAKINQLSQLLVRRLEQLPSVRLQVPDNTVRLEIVSSLNEALQLEEIIDAKVRRTLQSYSRRIVEGSREWDVMYQKLYDEELAKH